MQAYELHDGEEAARQNPDTFHIPPKAERVALKPGQHIAKLSFQLRKTDGTMGSGERMWVRILDRKGAEYIGRLDNDPFQGDDVLLRYDDLVSFESKHVIDICEANNG